VAHLFISLTRKGGLRPIVAPPLLLS